MTPRHELSSERVAGMAISIRELSSIEAVYRRATFGPNDIVAPVSNGWRDVLRETMRDPMIGFLIGTAILYAVLGDYRASAVLAFALLPIPGMDTWLHRRTRASTEGLDSRMAVHSRVLRHGAETVLATPDLVPGDLVVVSASEYRHHEAASREPRASPSTLTQISAEIPIPSESWLLASLPRGPTMNIWQTGADDAVILAGAEMDTDSRHAHLQVAFQSAFRDLAAELPRHELLRTLCRAIAEDLDMPLEVLLNWRDVGERPHFSTHGETLLWAEFMRFIDDCVRIELQRTLATALADSGNPAFVADTNGRIVRFSARFWNIGDADVSRAC